MLDSKKLSMQRCCSWGLVAKYYLNGLILDPIDSKKNLDESKLCGILIHVSC